MATVLVNTIRPSIAAGVGVIVAIIIQERP